MFGWGTATLIISNEEIKDIIKIVKSLEESGLWIKVVIKQLKMKQKIQKYQNEPKCNGVYSRNNLPKG